MKKLNDCSKEELIEMLQDAAKNWLAHDGLWFLEVEKECSMDIALKLDANAWEKFTVIEAKRIMERHNIKPNGGIPALIQALQFRLYAYINKQEVVEVTETRCVFRMNECRVQEARKRKNLPDFPCKPVGLVEYTNFAKTIDPRIKTKCICCPPDKHPDSHWCAWEFSIA
ncbi:MAG: hypothetical protein HY811_05095 [Planctomycetes bacterium]|nr:hypothetical protein [Planctomycetota bacterium]